MRDSWRADLLSGFLVFLIALPLCLGIALACGYPAIAGVFSAIIGGLVSPLLSNSELTIKGPAAGLIVIALGCVHEFGFTGGQDPAADLAAYRLALGVGVAAGVIQIGMGLFRAGVLGEFFPSAAVHGMLAAIGVIIAGKQIHTVLGVSPHGAEPLHLIAEIPRSIQHANPEIALIGLVSLVILFGLPLTRIRWLRMIPAPMVVVLVAVPLGIYFDLSHEHTYSLGGSIFQLGPRFLVDVPANMFAAITSPDFRALATADGWKWVAMFALIGSLESILSAKAIDVLDPWKRRSNLDRDMLAVGVGNTLAALVGGLPMISEIVRSKANIDNGARTRLANLFHGLLLLLFVALVPGLIHRIPLAALAAMLVYTGCRLASPREFISVYRIGSEQLVVFTATLIGVLATDLLVGIAIGIAVKLLLHLLHGVPPQALLRPNLAIEQDADGAQRVTIRHAAVFSNWIALRRRLRPLENGGQIVIDLSEARFIDHTVMEKLHELEEELAQRNCQLRVVGLDSHRQLSAHPLAARKRVPT